MKARFFLFVGLLVGCGPAGAPLTPAPPVPPDLPVLVVKKVEDPVEKGDPQRIGEDVKRLASDEFLGRGTGTEGVRLAADFVEGRFRDLGLEAYGDVGAKGVSFRQTFSARVGAGITPPTLLVGRKGDGKKGPGAPVAADLVTADGAESGEAKGEVVFVGHGVTASAVGWDDYAGKEIAGKIALVLDGPPKPADLKAQEALRDFKSVRYKLRTAREHKAAGVVVVALGEELPLAPQDASGMGIPAVVIKRSVAKTLFPEVQWAGLDKKEQKAAEKPKAITANVTVSTKIEPLFADAWNVVARLPARVGSKTADETVVIGAHYDHLGMGGTSHSRAPGVKAIHHGADDNASGTALLLDVARRMSKVAAKPERNIVFIAFGAEELGALGSRHWVEHSPMPVGKIVAMLNADMVGRLRDRTLVVDGTGTSAAWPELLNAANTGLGLNLKLGAEGFGASDHASFTAAKIPVAFFFTGVHDDYHLPSDTAEKIDAGGIDLVATLAARMLVSLSNRPERLTFVEAPAPSDPHKGGGTGKGFRVSLGTIPDYAWQGKGLKLTGVRPDAPAARAGLLAGDVVVKLGTHEITNVHDYTFALGDLEPGRETNIEVERDGKRITLKIIPAPGR